MNDQQILTIAMASAPTMVTVLIRNRSNFSSATGAPVAAEEQVIQENQSFAV